MTAETPDACTGYFHDVEQEANLAYGCQNDVIVFWWEVGGGAVYLNDDQPCFQLTLHWDNPFIPEGDSGPSTVDSQRYPSKSIARRAFPFDMGKSAISLPTVDR